MKIEFDSVTPIYIQISEYIEDLILDGSIKEGDQVPSTNQLAEFYKLNPATARKGLNILTDEGIVFKRRGVGMFVSEGAVKQIKTKRKEAFVNEYVIKLVEESKRLDLTTDDIIGMIQDIERRQT